MRLCEDTQFGRPGDIVVIPTEWAEAFIRDKKATVVADKSLTRRPGTIMKGGTDPNGR